MSSKFILRSLIGMNAPPLEAKADKPELPKCKYQISIYTEFKKLFDEEDDYYSGVKQFFGLQPLEDLAHDTDDIEKTVIQCEEDLSGDKKCFARQPNVELIQKGITSLHEYSEYFTEKYTFIRCKEGFADLMLANFAKLNNPTKFNILKNIFDHDNAPCAAYEEKEICPPLPMALDEVQRKIIEVAPEVATSFEISYP